MQRIPFELREQIKNDLIYTDTQRQVLNALTHVGFAGIKLVFNDRDRHLMTTEAGITEQLDSFVSAAGLIYWLKFDGNDPRPCLTKAGVDLSGKDEKWPAK